MSASSERERSTLRCGGAEAPGVGVELLGVVVLAVGAMAMRGWELGGEW